MVLSAIAASRLPAAEAIVATTFADPSQPASLRMAAAVASMQFDNPSAPTMATFASALQSAPTFDGPTTAGLFAFGALLERATGEVRNEATRTVVGLEDAARRQGALPTWLEALGNAGVDAALAAAERYRSHEQFPVRLAAVSAVRKVAGDAAWRFAAAALGDDEPVVRARAMEVLGERHEAGALSTMLAAVAAEPDARVRLTAVHALGDRVGVAEVRTLLERLRQDPAEDVRTAAASLLRGR
jgi:HEAT repeat protein